MDTAVIIFMKSPVKGSVKTRIGRVTGHDFSYNLYNILVKKLTCEVADLNADVIFSIAGHEFSDNELFIADNGSSRVIRQTGRDIGERMYNSLKDVFSNKYRAATLVGSDVPGLTGSLIEDSITSLDDHDLCLGPSCDGGYYLIGMKKEKLDRNLFSGISWSTPNVLQKTIEKVREAGLDYYLLKELQDIDTIDDIRDYYHKHRAERNNRFIDFLESSEGDFNEIL